MTRWIAIINAVIMISLCVVGCANGEQADNIQPSAPVAVEKTPQPTTAPAQVEEFQEDYYAVFLSGAKVGWSKVSRSVAGGEVATEMSTEMTLRRGEVSITVREKSQHLESEAGQPLGFRYTQFMGRLGKRVEGAVNSDGTMIVRSIVAGVSNTTQMNWPAGAVLHEGERLAVINAGLAPGTKFTVVTFVPMLLKAVSVDYTVAAAETVDLLGRVTELTPVSWQMHEPVNMSGTSYFDADFTLLRQVSPVLGTQMDMIACDRSFAMSAGDESDFLAQILLTCPVSLAEATGAEKITYRLTPKAGATLKIPAGDCQKVSVGTDGVVTLTVRPAEVSGSQALPYDGDDPAAVSALKPSEYVQSDDPRIRSLAAQAVGSIDENAQASVVADRIEVFVRNYITHKNLSVGYASAVEVAASRTGDCTEHAVLAAALCRAVGLPARVAMGLAYVDQFGGESDVFVPHAWVEVYIGGVWRGLDSALTGYDARHIMLATGDGDPESFFALIGNLGQFEITEAVISTGR